MQRTDPHRVSEIIPEDYSLVLCYALASIVEGWPVPSIGITCRAEHRADGRCCVVGMRQAGLRLAAHGSPGRCTVCGTAHIYGDVWVHEPTGEHIFVGHQCADKYELIADRRVFEAELDAARVRSVREHEIAIREERRARFLEANPGLAEALEVDHPITRDIRDSFFHGRYTSLTDAQVALVRKLAIPRVEEAHVPAPIEPGRQVVRGEVVSLKSMEGDFGVSVKMTVKISTDAGTWLAWGTCPSILLDEGVERGAIVEFMAKLKPGRDDHFALFSRPTKALLVRQTAH